MPNRNYPNDPEQELVFDCVENMKKEQKKTTINLMRRFGWISFMTADVCMSALDLKEV